MLSRARIFVLIPMVLLALRTAPAAAQGLTGVPDAVKTPPLGATSRGGMVVTSEAKATDVGLAILKRGGNAVDAAVAVGLTLAVTYPEAGNLGGGGFMLIRRKNGQVTVIDYRETAPARAQDDMYLDLKRNPLPGASDVGYGAVGVPGTLAGLGRAWERHGSGKLTWAELVQPALDYARKGFPVTPELARSLYDSRGRLEPFRDSRRIFLRDGNFYERGELFTQPELAETLKRLQQSPLRWREFYEGETAARIDRDMRRRGGRITAKDLKNYQPREPTPLRGTYRGCEILTMPPPSGGGVVLLQALGILERHDLAGMGPASAERYHLLIEALRRAFAVRAAYLDADIPRTQVEYLASKAFLDKLLELTPIFLEIATPSGDVKIPPVKEEKEPPVAGKEGRHTTHFSIVDAEGNAVSNTYTLNSYYGSGVTAAGTGVLLNNEMADFDTDLRVEKGPNQIKPGKRPLSSMTPTFVLKDGQLLYVLGTPGSRTIISTVLQLIINLIDHGMDIWEANWAARLHQEWDPDEDEIGYEPKGMDEKVMSALKARKHTFAAAPEYIGDVEIIEITPRGERRGSSDPRWTGGKAAGE